MPELPEVHTTVEGMNKFAKGLTIKNVWSDYNSPFHIGKNNIKDRKYFDQFSKLVIGARILGAERRAKNILINLGNHHTILIHMKMTGHILYGEYTFNGKEWLPEKEGPLRDPFNRFIRLVFTLSDGNHLVLADMRRFAKVCTFPTPDLDTYPELQDIGPEPLEKNFDFKKFKEMLRKRPSWKIKQALMDQSMIAGIGNIYSDEMLWLSGIHPESRVTKIPDITLKKLFPAMKEVLKKGIDFGGDSMSDYRNILGERGRFQHAHNAYRLTGTKCKMKNCKGIIKRLKVGGRSAHFCNVHQKKF